MYMNIFISKQITFKNLLLKTQTVQKNKHPVSETFSSSYLDEKMDAMYFTFTIVIKAYCAIAQICCLKLGGPKQDWCQSWQSTLAWDASSSWRKIGAPKISAGVAICGGASWFRLKTVCFSFGALLSYSL